MAFKILGAQLRLAAEKFYVEHSHEADEYIRNIRSASTKICSTKTSFPIIIQHFSVCSLEVAIRSRAILNKSSFQLTSRSLSHS